MTPNWLAILTTLLGLVCYFAASEAETYHAERFSRHTGALSVYADHEADEKITEEIEAFHTDRRLDWAAATMAWGYPLAILFFLLTAVLLLMSG